MTRWKLYGVRLGIGLVVGSFSWIPDTEACTPLCPEPLRAPTGPVPANALAIPLFDPATPVEVVGPGGPVVVHPETAADGTTLLRPTGNLTPGPHTLSYNSGCQGKRINVEFNVTEAAAAPTTLGRLSVTSAGIKGTSGVFVTASLTFDQSVYAYQSLLDLHRRIDGNPASFLTFNYGGARTIRVETNCPSQGLPAQDSCGGIASVPPGRHTLSFVPSIAGLAEPLSPVSIEVNLDCAWLNSVHPLSGGPDDESAGCAIARPRSNLGLGVLLITLLVGGRFWRRRRHL